MSAVQYVDRPGVHTMDPGARAMGDVGDPAAAILEAADREHVDVVVGSRHRMWIDHLFSRSVAGSVVRDADLPVLVVP